MIAKLAKFGLPVLALAGLLAGTAKPADARVGFGLYFGPGYGPYYSPYYYSPYYSPYYSYPGFGFFGGPRWYGGPHFHHWR